MWSGPTLTPEKERLSRKRLINTTNMRSWMFRAAAEFRADQSEYNDAALWEVTPNSAMFSQQGGWSPSQNSTGSISAEQFTRDHFSVHRGA